MQEGSIGRRIIRTVQEEHWKENNPDGARESAVGEYPPDRGTGTRRRSSLMKKRLAMGGGGWDTGGGEKKQCDREKVRRGEGAV